MWGCGGGRFTGDGEAVVRARACWDIDPTVVLLSGTAVEECDVALAFLVRFPMGISNSMELPSLI